MKGTILILHGWGSSSKNWISVKDLLEKNGYKVFTPDLPGFGNSPAPEKAWSVDDFVGWVKQYCGQNNLSDFFLLGHSFGGGIAIKFTNYFPKIVKGLILVAPAFRRRKTFKKYFFLILAKLGRIIFTVTGLILLWPLENKIKHILYRLAGTRDYYNVDAKGIVSMKESFKKVISEDLTSHLSKIKLPTLVIWGAKDVFTPISDAHLLKKEMKNATLEIISDGVHGLNMEKPEILAEKIIKFIED